MDKSKAIELLKLARKHREHAEKLERIAHRQLDDADHDEREGRGTVDRDARIAHERRRTELHRGELEAKAAVKSPISRRQKALGHAHLAGAHLAAADYHDAHHETNHVNSFDHDGDYTTDRPSTHAKAAKVHASFAKAHRAEAALNMAKAEKHLEPETAEHFKNKSHEAHTTTLEHHYNDTHKIQNTIHGIHAALGTKPHYKKAAHVPSDERVMDKFR